MSLLPSTFLDCVLALGFPDRDGATQYSATGFLYGHFEPGASPEHEGIYTAFLVTNRHVLAGRTALVLRSNPGPGEPAQEFPATLVDKGKPRWIGHEDPEIDVAILRINAKLLQEGGHQLSLFREDKDVLFHGDEMAKQLSEGDGAFILGFPMGQVGGDRNYVVVRRGSIARIQDSLAGQASTFLVDSFIFPGNSGGPVILRPEVVSIRGTQPIGSAKLIGLVSGYLPYQDVAISQQTQRPRIIFEENSGLAVIIPIDRVREIVDLTITKDRAEEASAV